MWESSCSGNTQKTNCDSSFCNVGGCNTQMLMEMGSTREIYVKSLRGTILQKSDLYKVINKGKHPRMISLGCNLLKMDIL